MTGTVALVGAGPGDPDLITVRGLALLRGADVVVHDRLVDARLLAEARPGALLISAAKRRGARRLSQDQINRLLIAHAERGSAVVRLKGGDPFVFGRGGEEADALARAGIPFEIVPGVSSAIAAPAYAGIPVTHRGLASSFAVVTASESADRLEDSVQWDRLATAVDTIVVLMGVAPLDGVVRKLLAAGRPPTTPAAVVSCGTTVSQRVVRSRLDGIVSEARTAGIAAPAVIVIGDVVALGARLAWFAGGVPEDTGGVPEDAAVLT
ncbi:MAG: uroporphyrinogen-III C-methyltransferase [Candidatus Rokubacteria bacterium]|nr:uroporphyrinogen-III C-methyltransferase [Candidatus Rokubacteria bacterium]